MSLQVPKRLRFGLITGALVVPLIAAGFVANAPSAFATSSATKIESVDCVPTTPPKGMDVSFTVDNTGGATDVVAALYEDGASSPFHQETVVANEYAGREAFAPLHAAGTSHPVVLKVGGVVIDTKTYIVDAACSNAPAAVKIAIPAAPSIVDDPAVKGDAHYTLPADTASIDWTLNSDGSLTAATKAGYEFTDGTTSKSFPAPVDKYTLKCVTLTKANMPEYATLTGNRQTTVTVTLKGAPVDYCNDWAFSGAQYSITDPASIWDPPQVVLLVNTKSVGKSGLAATVTVPATTCGQNDFYEGTGPAVGDKLAGQGQGYEADHKFLSGIFGGAPTWSLNTSGCETTNPPIKAKVYDSTCTALVINLYDTNAGANNLVVKAYIGETALSGVDSAAPDYSALTTFTGVPKGVAYTARVEIWLDGVLNAQHVFDVPAVAGCSTGNPPGNPSTGSPGAAPVAGAYPAKKPDTGDISLLGIVSALALVGGGIGIAASRRAKKMMNRQK